MNKKLMNEVLPTPVTASTTAPRARVLKHLRELVLAGSTVALGTGCPFGVVDPLPPPSSCTMRGTTTFTVSATIDAAGVMNVTISHSDFDFSFDSVRVTKGTLRSQRVEAQRVLLELQSDVSKQASFELSGPCLSTAQGGLLVTITLDGSTTSVKSTVVTSNITLAFDAGVSADAGQPDGGP